MYRIRPIHEYDFESFVEMAFEGQVGMTNLPKDRKTLQEYLHRSLHAFNKTPPPHDHLYLFVIEELPTMQLLGVSAIFSKTYNLNYFHLKEHPLPSLFPEVPSTCPILERVSYDIGPSEIAALFVRRVARKSGVGKLLSLARFLFMRAYPERFTDTVYADLRGVIDPDGDCPFWNNLGRHFLPISFTELMERRGQGRTEVIELIPTLPLYIDLLSQDLKRVIGEVHPHTQPALYMLLNQGFYKTNEVDLFDGGPRLIAKRETIRTIAQSKMAPIYAIEPSIQSPPFLLSNERLNFRATMGSLEIKNNRLHLDQKAAYALEVKEGDQLIYVEAP